MAALNEITARTGLSEQEAKAYMQRAEERIRLYLAYQEDEDVSRFSSVISDVACLLYDKNRSVSAAQTAWLETAGLQSKSYSEGPVSVSETYAGASGSAGVSVAAAYDTQIQQALNIISRFRRVRVVK